MEELKYSKGIKKRKIQHLVEHTPVNNRHENKKKNDTYQKDIVRISSVGSIEIDVINPSFQEDVLDNFEF